MKIFNLAKPRTPAGEARRREQELMNKLDRLMQINDEASFKEALRKDFGIVEGHPRYELIMSAWHDAE